MSGQPPESSGASILPFMTSVTTDIYERIDKLSVFLDSIKGTLKELIVDIKENLNKISKNVEDMIEQGEMNKQMTLEAFADSMNTLIQHIKTIRNENVEGLQTAQTQQMIDSAGNTANLLESRMYDIQIAFLINGVHALMNAIKTGNVVGVPVQSGTVAGAGFAAGKESLGAPIPTLSAADDSQQAKEKKFFGKGARKKTHDEIMEEKRKERELYGKYLK